MSTIFGVCTLVVAVVIANVCHLFFPRFPLAIYQILIGVLLALWPRLATLKLEPEMFMLLIIAPLMFNDGQSADYRALVKDRRLILSMTIYLALFTVLVAGLGLHLTLATSSLPLAFMLAAIITPTDAVAVKSLTAGVAMPENVDQALEHESLFNDASGLVLFDLALTSLESGRFSLVHGTGTFLYVFFGGIVFGALAGWLLIKLRLLLMQTKVDIGQIVIPLNLLTPLVVYWLAEEIHCSGILAVVSAGSMHSMLNERLQLTSAKVQIATSTIWQITSDILNGIVFVFLGLSLPAVLGATTPQGLGTLVVVALGLYLLTTGIRYLWARLNLVDLKGNPESRHHDALLLATGGIHGTITLALAFSIPTTINGHPLALRNTMILLAALVILTSILAGAIFFPRLLPPKQNSYTQDEFKAGLVAAVQSALDRINGGHDHPRERAKVADQLLSQLNLDYQVNRTTYRQLLAECYEVELQTIDDLTKSGQLASPVANQYARLLATTMRNNTAIWGRSFFRGLLHRLKWFRHRRQFRDRQPAPADQQQALRSLIAKTTWAVNDHLNAIQTPENVNEVALIRRMYLYRLRPHNRRRQLDGEVLHQLSVTAFQDEHSYIQQALAAGKLSAELARALNEHISIDELVYLQSS